MERTPRLYAPQTPQALPNERIDRTPTREGKPQPWLNMEREAAYESIIQEIDSAVLGEGKTGGEYLRDELLKSRDYRLTVSVRQWFTLEDWQKIRVLKLNSRSLSEVCGTEVERPIFFTNDDRVYQRFEGLFDQKPGLSHGLHISARHLRDHPDWQKVGIIMTHNDQLTAVHEMRHSVDPSVGPYGDAREGYHRLITELFAYYAEHILVGKGDWESLERDVADRIYFDSYTKNNLKPMVLPNWISLVEHVVDGVKAMSGRMDPVALQRHMVQSKTIPQLLSGA